MIPSSHHPSLICIDNAPSVHRWVVGSPPWKERASSIAKAYVYLLQSRTSGKFYTGWTTDLKRRLEEHNSGLSRYTKSRGLWELIGYEIHSNEKEAKKRERAFKRNPRMLSYFKKRALSSWRFRRLLTANKEVMG